MAYPDNITWITDDELVGRRVVIETAYDESEQATVVGVHPNNYTIRVRRPTGSQSRRRRSNTGPWPAC